MITSARHKGIVDQLNLKINELEEENTELLREKMVIVPTCQKAVEAFGKSNQMIVAIEEMSELIKALTKTLRERMDYNNLTEEIADVCIVLQELIIIFNCEQSVKKWKAKKIMDLAAKIQRGYD